ncbi:valine--tRNA ligase [candidate division KSB1 bacterium]|nr:valine--tRNA ligase [candidate division KSB1 bacterium]
MDKSYRPKDIEQRQYERWEKNGWFAPRGKGDPYCIVIPPPNVTGTLHMGHAFQDTIMDALTRYHRMQGRNTLWQPGMDHAGIATQMVVERQLQDEGTSRIELGRDKFVERVWEWKHESGGQICNQLRRMGASVDWQRDRFTMDDELSAAVTEVFVRLHDDGLIYRGNRLVNWDPVLHTALSDLEVLDSEESGHLWHFRYPLASGDGHLVVATTRPETMLGDVAVAVHPKDKRYMDLIGKKAILPIVGRELEIIADDIVDKDFGTGAVKVTPAHDPNDFLMAQRQGLVAIDVMNDDASMNASAGKFAGMDRLQARKYLLKDLKSGDFIEKVEDHTHSVGQCYRCKTRIEPRLSEQWFVKMKPLAEPALQAIKDGKIKLHPARWTKVFINWLENIHDWCISRQIWWGHQIPVYTCEGCDEVVASVKLPTKCKKCGEGTFKQEEDVLDTWFSSQLWPFATLGWPKKTADLNYFYPTDSLVTGPDIIFFWVSRMVMMGLEFMGEVPFQDVYFNGIIRDAEGRKMSKSLGNGIDPLEMVNKYSADAVRFSLLDLSAEGQDINLSERTFEVGRNFSNKVWNAFRFLWMNLEESNLENANSDFIQEALSSKKLDLADRWILSRCQRTIRKVTRALEQFKFHEANDAIYNFFWKEYCDWYLELIKPRLYNSEAPEKKQVALAVATVSLKKILQMLHPVIPFITEELWLKVRNKQDAESIMISKWPVENRVFIDDNSEKELEVLQNMIGAIRNIRGEMNVPPHKKAKVIVAVSGQNGKLQDSILLNKEYFAQLAKVDELECSKTAAKPPKAASAVINNFEIFLPLEGLIDFEVERARLEKNITHLEKQLEGLNTKLQSPDFLSKAPGNIVELEKKKKVDFESNLNKLKTNLESLAA